jgi:phage tail sheath protein FI
MPANFLHGIETIDVTDGVRSVRVVKTAVIGLIGTAPIWQAASTETQADLIDTPRLCLSDLDDVKRFGTETTGYTIPTALDLIRDQGRGVPIVVNVFDPARHRVAVAPAAFTFPLGNINILTFEKMSRE